MPSLYDRFNLVSDFELAGDQQRAIGELVEGLERGDPHQVLLGVTGSGKTFTMAQTIARVNRPTLVMVAQQDARGSAYQEFRRFFPDNAVEYFVSYYDYYQPEAYVPATDSYIEKEATINDEIDRMRLSATRSLFERRDVIIVASVSCIYGLGSPGGVLRHAAAARARAADRPRGGPPQAGRDPVRAQRSRLRPRHLPRPRRHRRGLSVVRGAGAPHRAVRRRGGRARDVRSADRQDAPAPRQDRRLPEVALRRAARADQAGRRNDQGRARRGTASKLESEGKLLEAQRLHQRTMFDLEMIKEIGYCHGIENYARHLTGRAPGEPPPTLLDYLPNDALIVVDESHQTVPQVRGMYHGDRSRKEVLVAYGFRLPSALDNRPLNFEEWEAARRAGGVRLGHAGPVRAGEVAGRRGRADHPADRADRSADRSPAGQGPGRRPAAGDPRAAWPNRERVLVTTLTKRMAEDLTQYYQELGVRVRYLHSDIETLERVQILRDLRRGEFDVLVGINLLREGLDLPEVSLVAILDADKEGFLRSGRLADPDLGPRGAKRQRPGDHVRRQDDRLDAHGDRRDRPPARDAGGLQPGARHHAAVDREGDRRGDVERVRAGLHDAGRRRATAPSGSATQAELDAYLASLQEEMRAAAANLDFEKAAALRDEIKRLRNPELGLPGRRGGPDLRVMPFIDDWLKKAALEVQEYVCLSRAGVSRRSSRRPIYRHDIVEQFDADRRRGR